MLFIAMHQKSSLKPFFFIMTALGEVQQEEKMDESADTITLF